MAHKRQASLQGSGAPTLVIPEFIGQVYLDVVNDRSYISTGLVAGAWEQLGVNAVVDLGGSGVNYVRFDQNPQVDDYFTVDGRVYMFDPSGGPAYDVAITLGGDAAASRDNARDAINGDASATVNAREGDGDVLQLVSKATDASGAFNMSEGSGGRLVLGNTNAKSAQDPAERRIATIPYWITNTDVATLAAGGQIPVLAYSNDPTSPTVGAANVLTFFGDFKPMTAAVNFKVQQFNGQSWVVMVKDSGAVFANGDLLLLELWV